MIPYGRQSVDDADIDAVVGVLRSDWLTPGPTVEPPALVSGSFHPMHDGHRRLAAAAEAHLGRPAWFEMSLGNAEKAEIRAEEAWARAAQAYGERGLVLTHAPLFSVKAELMPGVALTRVDVRKYGSTGQQDVYSYQDRFAGYYVD